MKFIAVAFALVLAGVSALPQEDLAIRDGGERIVTNNIERAIEELRERIVDAGLDPHSIDNYFSEIIIPPIGSSQTWIKNWEFKGLSDIEIKRLSYSVTLSRLQMTLCWPGVSLDVDSMGVDLKLLGRGFGAELGGSLAIKDVCVDVSVRVNIGIISGISVRSCEVDLDVGGIKSKLSVRVQDKDLSDRINWKLGQDIPNRLEENKNEINARLSSALHRLLDAVL